MVSLHNRTFDKPMHILHPGEFFSTDEDVILTTVLGSCVSIVLIDPVNWRCGMNHFMLPGNLQQHSSFADDSGRYGINAMELLINDMIKHGCEKKRLQAKIFGGGHVIDVAVTHRSAAPTSPHHHAASGHQAIVEGSIPAGNIRFAWEFLEAEGIPVLTHDTGGTCGRKILLFAASAQVLLKRIRGQASAQAVAEELKYLAELRNRSKGNQVTLF